MYVKITSTITLIPPDMYLCMMILPIEGEDIMHLTNERERERDKVLIWVQYSLFFTYSL